MKSILLACLIIAQVFVYSCARKRTLSNEEICKEHIQQAQAKLEASQAGSKQKTLIGNLVTAAKIHQQHNETMLCLEKVERALSLLQSGAPVNKP